MYTIPKKPTSEYKLRFGRLLEHYRHTEGLSQQALYELMLQRGYPFSLSTINKIELGTRHPSASFIYHVAECLQLDEQERQALVEAYLADITLNFMNEYLTEAKRNKKEEEANDPGNC